MKGKEKYYSVPNYHAVPPPVEHQLDAQGGIWTSNSYPELFNPLMIQPTLSMAQGMNGWQRNSSRGRGYNRGRGRGNSFRYGCVNIRSFSVVKQNLLLQVSNDMDIDLWVVTETWFDVNYKVNIHGFKWISLILKID